MARSKRIDPELEVHKTWQAEVQPTGLVVAPAALARAQVFPEQNPTEVQQALLAVTEVPAAVYSDPDPVLNDFERFAIDVLGWSAEDLAGSDGGPQLAGRLSVNLPDYGEVLRPDFAVIDSMGDGDVLMLVQVVERGARLDKPPVTLAARDGMRARRPAWSACSGTPRCLPASY